MDLSLYQFKYSDMEFSEDGQLDELIALDRYTIPAYDGYEIGDTVVAIVDKDKGTKSVAEIISINNEIHKVKDRHGHIHNVEKEYLQKPLETKPAQLWDRWAKGGASVEAEAVREKYENAFRELLDGYGYSPGGRIQLMLGQEYVTGVKANLTAFNCYVVRSPEYKATPLEQFLEVLDVAEKEALIMRRGGGVGLNISKINTVTGSNATTTDFVFYLDESHRDYEELLNRQLLNKLDTVTVVTNKTDFESFINESSKPIHIMNAIDSVEGLFNNIKTLVKESFKGSVVAIDFNALRYRNAIVRGVNGRSSGSVSWMELFVLFASLLQKDKVDNVEFAEVFSDIVHLIIQGGSRRGALMLVCNDDCPTIEKFVQRKKTFGYLSGANISVGMSDTKMTLIKTAKTRRAKALELTSEESNALKLWDLIITSAWSSAEPGIIFLERYNKESNSWYFHHIEATNPCGEQGLPAYGVCNLGHFVLPRYFDNSTYDVNWTELQRAIRAAVRLQDNIVDYTPYFLEENKAVQLSERRVGIGSMGLGTLLISMGLRYGSDEADVFIDKLYKFIAVEAYKASIDIAEEKGAFPKFEYDKFIQSGFMQRLLPELPKGYQAKLARTGIRNVTILTQAPTGSTGTYIDNIPGFRDLFGGTTTGIEPYYSWEYWRAGRLGKTKQTVDLVHKYMEENGIPNLKELPSQFVTAQDLLPIEHVKVQATIQKWTDSSISKTANCPSNYTVAQTDELYLQSYDLGLKGMTIYRDGSRDTQVLAVNEEDAKIEIHIEADKLEKLKKAYTPKAETKEVSPIQKRPKRLYGFTEKISFTYGDKFGKAYVTVNVHEGDVWEVFISTKEKEVSALAKALSLMTTKLLRLGAAKDNLQQVIDTLNYDQVIGTLPSALAALLTSVQKENLKVEVQSGKKEFELAECAECGDKAYDKGNCICFSCGVSKCN